MDEAKWTRLESTGMGLMVMEWILLGMSKQYTLSRRAFSMDIELRINT